MAVKKQRLLFRNIVFCHVLDVVKFKYNKQAIQTVLIIKENGCFFTKTKIAEEKKTWYFM